MAGKNRRQEEVRRRLAPGASGDARRRAREALAAELQDPERLVHHLRVFSQLAVVADALAPCRLPTAAFLDALLAPQPEGTAPDAFMAAVRQAVLERCAGPAVLDACAGAIEAAQGETQDSDALLALTAGGVLLASCRQAEAGAAHPFWDVLFEVSLTDAILSGGLLVRLAQDTIEADPAALAKAFTKALAGPDLARRVDALGCDAPDATALAAAYAELLTSDHLYHLQLDALLHLARAHVRLAEEAGKAIAREGFSQPIADRFRQAYAEAYANDVDDGLSKELRGWFERRLEALRDAPEELEQQLPHSADDERRRCLAAWLGLACLPLDANPLLQAIHAQSLVRVRQRASELEQPFVARLWSRPTDRFALEQYEQFLRDQRHLPRARRVKRYLEALRAEGPEAEATAPEDIPPPGGDQPPARREDAEAPE